MINCARFLHTLYCDDVRMEVGEKMTFVGAYQGGMNIQHLGAAILPKLCAVVTAQTPITQPFKSLRFKLLKDDELLHDLEVPKATLLAAIESASRDKDVKFNIFGAILTIQPFIVEKSCVLRVQAETESDELFSSALTVTLSSPLDAAQQ